MLFDIKLLGLIAAAALAYFVKGATGFGPAMVFISLGTLLIGAQPAIVISTMLDVVGGFTLFFADTYADGRRFWIPLAIMIVIGSVIGGTLLAIIPLQHYKIILGGAIILLGSWFVFGSNQVDQQKLMDHLPEKASLLDMSVSLFAGFCGGFFGISGPPLIFYLGRKLAKSAFRKTLIPIFLMAAIARILTYLAGGLVTIQLGIKGLIILPGLFIGLYLGNHLFIKMNEIWFRRFIGLILILTGTRLML